MRRNPSEHLSSETRVLRTCATLPKILKKPLGRPLKQSTDNPQAVCTQRVSTINYQLSILIQRVSVLVFFYFILFSYPFANLTLFVIHADRIKTITSYILNMWLASKLRKRRINCFPSLSVTFQVDYKSR